MGVTVNRIRIPITNFQFEDYEDDRFKRVKIFIAHTGENLNGTSFSLEAFENMIPSLAHTPIVGYVEANEDGEEDFSDHRQRIVFKDGDIEHEYLGQAYGFIPQDNNAQIEYRDGKEWLTAEGYLWTKFAKGVEIMENARGSKSHSMEITYINGFVDDYGVLNVTDAKFSGLCILGDDVAPAMTGSTVEFFNADGNMKKMIEQMMMEFSKKGDDGNMSKVINKFNTGEDPELDDDTVVEPENVDPVEPEEPAEPTEPETTEGDENPEQVEPEPENEPETPEDDSDDKGEDDGEDDTQEYTLLSYKLSYEDTQRKIYKAIETSGDYGYILETYSDSVIYTVYTDDGSKYFKANYTMNGNNVSLGDKTEVLSMFVSAEEKASIESNRARIEQLTAELEELQSYKANIERESKEKLLESYASKLSKDSFDTLSTNIDDFDMIGLEKEIAFSIFKEESYAKEGGGNSVGAYSFSGTTGKYGEYDRLFIKQ